MAWGSAWRSAARSSTLTVAGCGGSPTVGRARCSPSVFPRQRPLERNDGYRPETFASGEAFLGSPFAGRHGHWAELPRESARVDRAHRWPPESAADEVSCTTYFALDSERPSAVANPAASFTVEESKARGQRVPSAEIGQHVVVTALETRAMRC